MGGLPGEQQCREPRTADMRAPCSRLSGFWDASAPLTPSALAPQDDDIPGITRYHTYEVLKEEVGNPRLRWAYLPYSMHMAGPREAIQHMIIRKNYGGLPFFPPIDTVAGSSALARRPQLPTCSRSRQAPATAAGL